MKLLNIKKRIMFLPIIFALLLSVSACNNNSGENNLDNNSKETDLTVTEAAEIPETASQAAVKLDTTYQTMIGFGAGFTWYSDYMLKNPETKEEMADLLFKDAKMTILRFKNEYGYSGKETISSNSRETQIYNLAQERASEYGEDITVLMSCWSPPKFLKSNDDIKGSGTIKKDENGEYMYTEYGEWWADSVAAYEGAGVPVDYISIQNECDFEVSYDGMEMAQFESETEAAYSKAFLSTFNSFKERFGNNAPLMLGPETMSVESMRLKLYMKDVIAEAPESVAGIAFHLYHGGDSENENDTSSNDPESFNQNFRDNLLAFGDDYQLWQTEFFRGTPLQTATLISNSLTVGNLSAYIHWTGVWTGRVLRHDILNVTSSGDYIYGSTYWVMRHFSEFIRPGYERVQVEFSIRDGYKVSAFKKPDGTKIAVVFVNNTNEDIEAAVPVENYKISGSAVYQTVLAGDKYDDGEYYNNLGALPENKTIILKAESITTIDISGNVI